MAMSLGASGLSAPAPPSQDAIWHVIDQVLTYHQKPGRDLTPTDALNRLFARHVRRERLRGMPQLDRTTCSVTCEARTASDLRSFVRWHGRARPRFESYPIVVARCDSRFFVLDGNNRTNKWIAEASPERRSVIVIRPTIMTAEQPSRRWFWINGWRPAFERLIVTERLRLRGTILDR